MADFAERRRYSRLAIELPGVIRLADQATLACTVRDFCLGGMLLSLRSDNPSDPRPADHGRSLRFEAAVATAEGEKSLHAQVELVWQRGDLLGVAFSGNASASVKLMRQFHGGTTKPPLPPGVKAERALRRMIDEGVRRLPALLNDFMQGFGDRLRDHSLEARSDNERQQVFADLSALDVLRRDAGLSELIVARARDVSAPEAGYVEPTGDGLSLVDAEDFERWLEASRVATLLGDAFAEPLRDLRFRLASLRKVDDPNTVAVPFEPRHFTSALHDFAGKYEFCLVTRRIMFDVAGKVLGDRLGDLYRDLGTALDFIGAPSAAPPKPERAVPEEAAKADAAAPGSGRPPADAQKEPAATRPRTPPAGSATTHTTTEVQGHEPHSFEISLASHDLQREGHADQLLSCIADESRYDDQFSMWLDLLAEPLKQAAVRDPGFFRDAEHPVRGIVDSLGQLQIFRADDPNDNDALSDLKIIDLLSGIDPNAPPERMRHASGEIRKITDTRSLRFQRNSELVVESAISRDRQRHVRLTIIHDLNARYADREVPVLLLRLLKAGWYAVLKVALYNEVIDGDRYAENLRLLELVAGRLGGRIQDFDDDPQLSNRRLLQRISAELQRTSVNPMAAGEIESSLRRQLAIQPVSPARLMKMRPLRGRKGAAEEPLTRPDDIPDSDWRKLMARCDAIAVGDTLRLARRNLPPLKLQVAWIRQDRDRFILVDHQGVLHGQISRAALANGLQRQHIEQIMSDGRPLSERAVDTLLDRMERQLAQQTSRESLTGLINRQRFQGQLERRLADGAEGALLSVDLDQFRLVNDIYGYDAGDRLLIAVAQVLEEADGAILVAHQGADRFLVLLQQGDESAEAPLSRAQGICAAVAALPFAVDDNHLNPTASIGLVELGDRDAGAGDAISAAETALASAKLQGGNTVYQFRDDDPGVVRERASVQWLAQVDQALDKGHLHLRCQAIVPVKPGSPHHPHYEVLLSVANGDSQTLSIQDFISAAERYKRMRAVDRWVTRTVVEWISANRQSMPQVHGLAVNLSGQTASDPQFVAFVRDLFGRHDIDPSWLSFEITETAAVMDLTSSANIVSDLKGLGCRVALDDFGSGLASYSYLKELPVDWLKIDGAFVRKITADANDLAVVRSINEIGHFMGKLTIAEYVTDDQSLTLLREVGVDFAQGYGIAAPLPLDDLLNRHTLDAERGQPA